VLAANARLARHLRWQYHRTRLLQGDRAWATPNIVTLDGWLEAGWEQSLLRGGDVGRLQLLNRGQFRRAVEIAGDDLDTPGAFNLGPSAQRLLGRAWNESRAWDIGMRDLRAAAATPDTRFFAQWAARFEALCEERSWIDSASLTSAILPEIRTGGIPLAGGYVLAGFDRGTAVQHRLFAALDDLGLIAGQILPGGRGSHASVRAVEATDARDERGLVARWAREHLVANPAASIGVIVPDLSRHAAEFRRSFLDAFDPLWRERDGADFPVTIEDGSSLADANLVHIALLLLQVPSGRLDYRDLGQLLRSPYLAEGIAEAPARAQFEVRVREQGLQQIDLRHLARSEREERPRTFLKLLGRTLALAETTRGRREPAGWLPVIDKLLKEAGFAQGRLLGQDEEAARDAWNGLLEQFGTLGEVVGEVTFAGARRLLAEAARDQRLNPVSRADGVQIMSPWDTDGYDFDAVWVCGMTSDAWPPVPRPSPLIPIVLQRDRGIPESLPDAYRAQAQTVMSRLLQAAPETLVSWPANTGEEAHVSAPAIENLARIPRDAEIFTDIPDDFRTTLGRGPEPAVVPDPPPALAPDEAARGGSRLVDMQSACPARAFFELRLGARELRSPAFGLDAAARGIILHDAAEHLYTRLQVVGALDELPQADLDTFVDAAVIRSVADNVPRQHPLANTLRENETLRLSRLLHMLVARDRERGPFRIVELERSHTIEVAGIRLDVRLDRVDKMPDGTTLVIDYKSGAHFSLAKCLGDRPAKLQLPLYAAFEAADGFALYWLHAEQVRVDAFGIVDFGGLIEGRNRRRYLLDDAAWSVQIKHWRAIVEELIGEFVKGDCRIDVETDALARAQFAMLTRRWDIEDIGADS
jgi:ATP-dependent helicase/nuclease subunit B